MCPICLNCLNYHMMSLILWNLGKNFLFSIRPGGTFFSHQCKFHTNVHFWPCYEKAYRILDTKVSLIFALLWTLHAAGDLSLYSKALKNFLVPLPMKRMTSSKKSKISWNPSWSKLLPLVGGNFFLFEQDSLSNFNCLTFFL